jgi:DNA-binding response OmpR family regulator
MLQEIAEASEPAEVLLVDDEPQLLKLLANVLGRNPSYHVTTACSGEEALDLSRNRFERFDLLVTDINMGGMSGIELYEHIREERPETRILFISAVAHQVRESHPECSVLQKPFVPRHFAARVEEVLSRTSRP